MTITGLLELLGAIGLLLPATAGAARHHLTIGGKATTRLPLRTFLQTVYIAALVTAGCPDLMSDIAIWSPPGKTPSANIAARAKQANPKFWDAFHGGRYDELPEVLNVLTAAYLENPRDAQTAAHIGFSHIWRVSEQARLDTRTATITDDLVLARKYFSEAVHAGR